MRFWLYWISQQIDWDRAWKAAAGVALLLFVFFACSNMADTGSELIRDRTPTTTLAPTQVREQEQFERSFKAQCSLWWADIIELPEQHAQICVETGWGR